MLRAAGFFTGTLENFGRKDHVGAVEGALLPELDEISVLLERYRRECAIEIPSGARQALDDYLAVERASDLNIGRLQALATLVILRSRFEYALRASEAEVISLVELAFEHLRRQILVDEQTRTRWQDAFVKGEVQCEKLGAVHLLAHGVWAFKVQGERAVTDLVLAEPAQSTARTIGRVARTVALTEWKLVRDGESVEAKAKEARLQTAAYAAGILGGLELRSRRYVVLVAPHELDLPDDRVEGRVVYRHVGIVVDPATPSVAARRSAG